MKCNITFFGHVTPLVPALASHDVNGVIKAPIDFLGQGNWIEMQHDFSANVMLLALHCQWYMVLIPALVLAPAPKFI